MLQTLCLYRKPTHRTLTRMRRWSCLVLMCWMSAHTFMSTAQTPTPAAVTTPQQSLELQARQWAAQQPMFQGRRVGLAPLDPRIAVQPCQQMLQFDQPFPGQPSVRVRCAIPSWQLFITLTDAATGGNAARTGTTAPSGTIKVLVAREALKHGTLLSPSMFTLVDMPSAGLENQVIQDAKLVSNMELVRDLLANTPLKTFDVRNAVLVKRGQDVLVTAGSGQGFLITVKAEALQDGGIGETIRLKNAESNRSLSAEITGPGTAKMK